MLMFTLFFDAISFFIGICCYFCFHVCYLFPLIVCMCFLWKSWKLILRNFGFFCAGTLWALFSYSLPSLPKEGIQGKGLMQIQSIAFVHSPFQKSLVLKGILKSFQRDDLILKNIPCQIYLKNTTAQLPQTSRIFVEGILIQKKKPFYILKKAHYSHEKGRFCFPKYRFECKRKVLSFLKNQIPNKDICSLLFSMVTGEIDERRITLEFHRFGLLHLLGIAGFQLEILMILLRTLLKKIYSFYLSSAMVLISLSGYCFFLGSTPALQRAYVMLVSREFGLYGYRLHPLNRLGLSLVIVLIYNPLAIFNLGFQFSFLCAFSAMVAYPFFEKILHIIVSKRTFVDFNSLSWNEKAGYILSRYYQKTIAFIFAIQLINLPIILYYFHKISFLAFCYNLFLPPLVTTIYICLIVAIMGSIFFPFLSSLLFLPTKFLASILLNTVSFPPALYDFQWRFGECSFTIAIMFLTILVTAFLLFYKADHRIFLRSR